jgi:hypothetical protein
LTQRKQDTLLISSTPYVPPIGRAWKNVYPR